jgi:pimeloyl-ACP methyl ester carboxylesterase
MHIVALKDGTKIAYNTAGEENGPPVVLLHGGGTDHVMLSWRDTLPALVEAGYRVYAPNYPGYGESPPSSSPVTIENLIGYLHQLLDIWKLRQAALIGVSLGGGLATGYALQHQERVRRMILIGSYGIQDKAPYHAMSYFMVRMPWLMNATWALMRKSRRAARYSLSSIIYNPDAHLDELVDEVFEAMQNLTAQKAFGEFQRDEIQWNGVKTNYTTRLSEISIPVLLVHGDKDIGVPLKYAQRAAACFQNARLEVFEKAGHWTQRDYPERFNKLALEFLGEDQAVRIDAAQVLK